MKVTYVRWLDACQVEADAAGTTAAEPYLAELHEVGFLLAENNSALLIGMEADNEEMHPGRWRLNIPKSAIIERRDMDMDKAFPVRRKRKK